MPGGGDVVGHCRRSALLLGWQLFEPSLTQAMRLLRCVFFKELVQKRKTICGAIICPRLASREGAEPERGSG